MIFADQYLREVEDVARGLDRDAIENVAKILADVRSGGGRVFILGVGGSAGSEQGGSTSQGGAAGEPNGSGGSDDPGVGWYCNISVSGCVCVQEPLEVGDCGVFNCCYTYNGGPAGLACACNDALATSNPHRTTPSVHFAIYVLLISKLRSLRAFGLMSNL